MSSAGPAARRAAAPRPLVVDRRRALHAAESGIWFLLFTSFWTASFPYISVGVSVVIVSSSVFMTFVVTSVRRRDLDLRGGLGCVIALLAVVPSLIGEQSHGRNDVWMGVALAGLGATFGTAYYLSLDRSRTAALPADVHSAIASLTAGVLGSIWTVAHGGMFAGVNRAVFGMLIALAIVPHLLGQGLLVGVAAGGRTVLSNMAVVGEAVGSALIAAVWFGEPLSPWLGLSILLFLIGAVLLTSSRSNQGTADAP